MTPIRCACRLCRSAGVRLLAVVLPLALSTGACLVADPNDYRDRSLPTTEILEATPSSSEEAPIPAR
jgi:hypothetical protein